MSHFFQHATSATFVSIFQNKSLYIFLGDSPDENTNTSTTGLKTRTVTTWRKEVKIWLIIRGSEVEGFVCGLNESGYWTPHNLCSTCDSQVEHRLWCNASEETPNCHWSHFELGLSGQRAVCASTIPTCKQNGHTSYPLYTLIHIYIHTPAHSLSHKHR